jgi:predicted methyltransferase
MRTVATLLTVLLLACGGAPSQPQRPAPAPLVHRFQDPARWSKEFDDPARDAWQKPGDVLTAMNVAPGMTVADIGAGTGYFERWLSRAVGPSGTVLAVDIEPSMVDWIERRAARERWGNVRAVLGAVDDPKLPAGHVDRVLVVDTWHHIPNRVAYAAKLRAALAPGGTLTIVEFTRDSPRGPPPPHRIAPDAVEAELRAAGFAVSRAAVDLPYQYVVVAR